ncbi:hypothetical protein [Streptomyces sp. AM6-12]|uniref:hypothetical protein n=1 Tax=Streptomyces sp. AM6-12 TaxID=3345149 RepID=UPI00379488E9
MRITFAGCLAGLVATAAFPVAATTSAHAASQVTSGNASHTVTFTVPAGRHGATVTADGASVTVVGSAHALPDDLTTCSVTVTKPSRAGTTQVMGGTNVNCTARVASLNIVVALYRNGNNVSSNQTTVSNASYGGVSDWAPYASGSWKTGGLCTYFGYDGNGTSSAESYSQAVTL